jgi:hypothetical protein
MAEEQRVSETWPYGQFSSDFVAKFNGFGERNTKELFHRDQAPLIQFTILARNASPFLPLFLESISNFDFPRKCLILDVVTNDNSDDTSSILEQWTLRHRHEYRTVFYKNESYETIKNDTTLTWSDNHFQVIKNIRNASLRKAIENRVDFLFLCDVDVFLLPQTLSSLVDLNLPIVAPLIRFDRASNIESNFAPILDSSGWPLFKSHLYGPIVSQIIRGIIEVPLVHSSYLIRKDALEKLSYSNLHSQTSHEFLTFAENARKSEVSMYLDNRQLYGVSTTKQPDDPSLSDFLEAAKSMLSRSW